MNLKSSERGGFAFSRKDVLAIQSQQIATSKSPAGRREYCVKGERCFPTVVELVKHCYESVSKISIGSLADPIACLDGKISVVSELARNESSKMSEFLTIQVSLTWHNRLTENGRS